MNIYFFLMILMLGHWIGDFVFQDNKMALNKSDDSGILAYHCIVYSVTIALFYLIGSAGSVLFITVGLFILWMFFSHFVIDFVTARANKKLWMNNQRHWFFVMVGFDQFLHLVTILVFLKIMVM